MVQVWLRKNFRKKINSTKKPAVFDLMTSGEFKSDFSPMALEMVFDFSEIAYQDPSKIPEYNYAHIPSFNRYYFITSWVYSGGMWVAEMTVDVLASYIDEIKEQTQYILRSQSDPSHEIIDTTYLQKGKMHVLIQEMRSATYWGWDETPESGCVVCGIIGSSNNNVGAVTYYAMSYAAFNSLMSTMLADINWLNISASEISKDLQKALINPTQYIVSAHWLPLRVNNISGAYYTYQIRLGWWNFNLSEMALVMNAPASTVYINGFLNIDRPSKAPAPESEYAFLRLSPYSRYTFKFLPFGIFELDTAYLFDAARLSFSVRVSPMTGDAILQVQKQVLDTDGLYYTYPPIIVTEANVAVQLPTGQVAANIGNFREALTAGAVAGLSDLTASVQASQASISSANTGFGQSSGQSGGGRTAPGLGGGRR